jgi:hypothetical protein
MSDKWNKSYVQRLAKKGPGGIKSGNLGMSYLVAPMYTQDERFQTLSMEMKSKIKSTNQKYLDVMNREMEEKVAAQPTIKVQKSMS